MNENSLVITSAVLTGLLLLATIWQGIRINKLNKVREEFFANGIKTNLEDVLVDQNRKLTSLSSDLNLAHDQLAELAKLNKDNIQKIGFIRFNPFSDAGGNMSFAIAVLNDHDDGIVISSLHSREGTRVYGKSVRAGKSESKLTDEEEQAIKEAK